MLVNSIDTVTSEKQYDSLWNFELSRFKGDQVFCPMCEDWHINNSACQRTD